MKEAELLAYLAEKRLVRSEQARVTPLSGGVSCQILLIEDGDTRFVLKKALEKLKVKDEWFADVKRNQTEQRYLTYVAAFLPDVVPSILYSDAEHHFFCMEMLDNGLKNWKELLLDTHYHLAYAQTSGGGWWPAYTTNEEPFEVFLQAIENAGYVPGKDVAISLDIAASDLFDGEKYNLKLEHRSLTPDEFYDLMASWCDKYPVISIEDPFSDTDFAHWKRFYAEYGSKVQIIGDDLFTTNIERITHGIEDRLANAVLIKLNQIGTVTETIEAIRLTQDAGWLPVVSARSGETEDAFISHLAVATNAGQLKVGSFARSERMVKWNENLRIQRSLGSKASFLGGRIYERILK